MNENVTEDKGNSETSSLSEWLLSLSQQNYFFTHKVHLKDIRKYMDSNLNVSQNKVIILDQ